MSEKIIGIGELDIGCEDDLLVALGLGSCVGVALYDSVNKVGGLAHVMLADSGESETSFSDTQILIADSDAKIRGDLKKIFSNNNINVIIETKEGEETLKTFRKTKPNISFISAFLPPKNGIETVQKILGIDASAKTIVLAPQIDKKKLYSYLELGSREVIMAPFTEDKIMSTLRFLFYNGKIKFADKAIPTLVGRMLNRGAKKENIKAKIVGGAQMFTSITDSTILEIGKNNVEASKKALSEMKIPIVAEETGNHVGRTVRFDVNNGKLNVKSREGVKEL